MAVSTHYKARVVRDGKYWAIEVDGVGPTQARHLRELDEMTHDLIETLVDDPGDFEVEYDIVLPEAAAEHMAARAAALAAAEAHRRAAAAEHAAAAAALQDLGINLRDAGRMLGVSYQRVGQLVHDAR